MKRSPELDFLRGIAVILVLFRHHWVGIDALQHVGWIGVDLFFVLSGFLVSGLLFTEYQKFGNIKPFRFLVRRAFKIYPLFYLSLILTFIASAYVQIPELHGLNWKGQSVVWFSEVFFLQNYFVSVWPHHWSLAVEEHFYLLLALMFPLLIKRMKFAPLVFVACVALRVWTVTRHPELGFGETHLRLDSLFMGVCISHAYHFGNLHRFYEKYKPLLTCLTYLPLLFLFTDPLSSWWIKTFGFSLLYISFGSLLILFMYGNVRRFLWKPITTIGLYSYGIYLFHLYLIRFLLGDAYLYDMPRDFTWDVIPRFIIFFAGSIALGIVMSKIVEYPLLKVRDKWFPRRGSQTVEMGKSELTSYLS